jgi:hypothetical protein
MSNDILTKIQAALNDEEYPLRGHDATFALAKEHGIVIVFGASDDLVELRGAIHDELGAFDGTTFKVDEKGVIPKFENIDSGDKDALEDYFRRKNGGRGIEAIWAPKYLPETSWVYKTDIPHTVFNVIEHGDVYCVGIIFKLEDLAVNS